jgi:hypothetical protein
LSLWDVSRQNAIQIQEIIFKARTVPPPESNGDKEKAQPHFTSDGKEIFILLNYAQSMSENEWRLVFLDSQTLSKTGKIIDFC